MRTNTDTENSFTYMNDANESVTVGIIQEGSQWLALTATASKRFKTRKGAEGWMVRKFPGSAKRLGLV